MTVTLRDKPMTPSEEIVAGSVSADAVTDARGRVIGVKKLSPLTRMRAFKMAGAEASSNLPYMGYIMTALMVTSIDGVIESPPQTELQVQALISRLDEDGLEAVNEWYSQKFGNQEEVSIEALKNE